MTTLYFTKVSLSEPLFEDAGEIKIRRGGVKSSDEKKMIQRPFAEPKDVPWKEWRLKADAGAGDLITLHKAGKTIVAEQIKEALYKGGRQFLWDAFDGKCAYCEAKFVLDQAGDVEHFRPKLGVTDEDDNPVLHPGYFWLAYDWRNLLPSCARCNRLTRTASGKLIGKGERFPVIGIRAMKPGEEEKEQAVFIHPVVENPEDHLLLDVATGVMAGKSERGKLTIELLGLNREGLREERRKTYVLVRGLINDCFAAFTSKTSSLFAFQWVFLPQKSRSRRDSGGREAEPRFLHNCLPRRVAVVAIPGGVRRMAPSVDVTEPVRGINARMAMRSFNRQQIVVHPEEALDVFLLEQVLRLDVLEFLFPPYLVFRLLPHERTSTDHRN